MKKRVADIIVEELIKNDIIDCFAVVGGGAMHLDNALAIHDGIHKIFNHHEQACAMAAEAYARLCGKMACVCVTSGPGALNTLNGVAGAWEDSIPMIVLSGQVRYETSVEKTGLSLRYRGVQEFEIIDSVKNMTKYAVKLKDPKCVRREVNKAIHIAMAGRRGPVWVDVPLDIQSTLVEVEELEENEVYEPLPDLKNEDLDNLKQILSLAKRPCILAGSAIISSDVKNDFRAFIAQVQIPVVGGSGLADVLPVSYERYYGCSGNIGSRAGNFILQNADTILVLGSSLSFRQTGFAQEAFAPKATIIMVDIDENESKKPGLKISQFIYTTLKTFFDTIQADGFAMTCQAEWVDYCETVKDHFSVYEGKDSLECSGRVGQYNFWEVYNASIPDDMITVLGNNTAVCAKQQTGVRTLEQKVVVNYTIGSMGYDLPAAIGAAVASRKEIICATGDGSIMMNLQEMQTIKQYNLPIKIILFSNGGYNAIRQTCKNFFDGVFIGCTAETGVSFPDFGKVAELFGFEYRRCENNLEIKECIDWLLESNGNVFLDVQEKYDDPLIPKVMSRINEDGTFSTPALHDMSPFLPIEEINKFMLDE
ncbi:MAG: thiamine pyrophosphate-binding protein [Lachnospiraceae bacterium]|nr:thiamine pyrophosphate-binding protein [Lachnospiraceae bacterium]